MKYILNILDIILDILDIILAIIPLSVLVIVAHRLGIPFGTLVWYLLGGLIMMLAVLAVDCAILDLWAENCRDRPIPSSILDLPKSIVGLSIILWPLTTTIYLPVRCAILARRRLEARRKRSSPEGVSPTHTTQGSDPGASTPPIRTF